jgi:hypothetical protein
MHAVGPTRHRATIEPAIEVGQKVAIRVGQKDFIRVGQRVAIRVGQKVAIRVGQKVIVGVGRMGFGADLIEVGRGGPSICIFKCHCPIVHHISNDRMG